MRLLIPGDSDCKQICVHPSPQCPRPPHACAGWSTVTAHHSHGTLRSWGQITSLPALDPPTAVLCTTRGIQTAGLPLRPPLGILPLSSSTSGFLFLPTGTLHVLLLLPRTFFPFLSASQATSHQPGPSPKAPSLRRPPKSSGYSSHSNLVSCDIMFCLSRGPFLLGTCPICSFACSFSISSTGMLVSLATVSGPGVQ